MTLVVDASIAFKVLVEEAGSEDARRLLLSGGIWIAPDIVVAETANALWRNARKGTIGSTHFQEAVDELPRMYGELVPSALLVREAAVLARKLDHPIYDCLYVALARERTVELATADVRLLHRLGSFEGAPAIRGMS